MPRSWAIGDVDLHLDVDGTRVRGALERTLRDALRSGRLAPGTRLPSSRALARDLGLARNTVAAAYAQLVAEGCLVVFGPYVSDNVVPLRSHVERTAEVPIITLAGSEGALGEWCFALNNGSMAEEPVMLAAVLKADGHSRIAIAHETSLIGKEYLGYAERAYEGAGLQIVGSVAIPQVETDKVDAVTSLRATNPDAVVHVGENNVLQANIYAPRGTVRIKSKTQATGAFLGDHVRIGQNVTLRLDSAFK